MSVNGPISPKQCYYEMDYSFYSFYWLDCLEIRLDHNSTYYRSLSKNSDVKPSISHCDSQNLQYKTHPEFWPSHRWIFKTSLYYKTRLILETRRYIFILINVDPKSILVPCTLFRLIPYAVIRVFTVECILKCVILLCYTGDFEKCTTLFHYFSLLCYLELRSNSRVYARQGSMQVCATKFCWPHFMWPRGKRPHLMQRECHWDMIRGLE